VSRHGDLRAKSLGHLQDGVRRRRPVELGLGLILGRHELLNLGNQLPVAREASAANGSVGADPKPALHQVDPGSVGGLVVNREARPLRQPVLDFWVLVGAVVIHNQMDVQVLWHRLLDLPEEAQVLLVPVARLAMGEHLAGGHVQGGKQSGGAVADVVVGGAFHIAQAQGQQRLGPVQGLDLRLLVNAKHHRPVGRTQVQADDVADLLHKEKIRRQLVAVRLPRSVKSSAGVAGPRGSELGRDDSNTH
jgi:hypothetical protein